MLQQFQALLKQMKTSEKKTEVIKSKRICKTSKYINRNKKYSLDELNSTVEMTEDRIS